MVRIPARDGIPSSIYFERNFGLYANCKLVQGANTDGEVGRPSVVSRRRKLEYRPGAPRVCKNHNRVILSHISMHLALTYDVERITRTLCQFSYQYTLSYSSSCCNSSPLIEAALETAASDPSSQTARQIPDRSVPSGTSDSEAHLGHRSSRPTYNTGNCNASSRYTSSRASAVGPTAPAESPYHLGISRGTYIHRC
jgi:hypothetical protein